MSVLIKGIEMPTAPIILILFPDGHVETEEYNIGARSKAIPVPPHGRLIDADALLNRLNNCMFPSDMVTTYAVRMATNWIKDAPTVEEAEEGE